MILKELNKLNKKQQSAQSSLTEANITALGKSAEYYDIQFRNTSKAKNVYGPTGLRVGDSVTVAVYPGKTKRYVILAKSYKTTKDVTTVWV